MTAPDDPTRTGGGSGARWADLAPRIGSGLLLIAVALGTAVAGGHVFALFWLLAAGLVVWEWQRLIGRKGAWARTICGAVALAVAVPLASAGRPGAALAVGAIGAAAAALLGQGRRVLAATGVGYAAALAVSVVLLRDGLMGLPAVLWLFAVVWGTDIGAYFAGRMIGGPRLSPRWSPKKTWSGLAGGVAAGALLGVAVAPAGSSHGSVFVAGIVAGLLAQAGDIAESALKRRFDVKDSSALIPGHGGVMDRVDGFVVAAVFAAALGSARAGMDAAAAGLFYWQ